MKRSDVTLIDSYLEDIPQGAKERVESNALPIDFPSDLIAPKLFICHSKYQTSVKIVMLLYFNRHTSIHYLHRNDSDAGEHSRMMTD